MQKPIVEVKNLTKKFGPDGSSGFLAVNNISFSIQKGEIVGLLGPNGAGKTTTIHMLLGLITPTGGVIKIFGKNFSLHREVILSDMNFSSTYTHLPWRLSVWENLHIVALLYDIVNPRKRVDEVIEKMHLTKYRNTEVGELSSGWVTRLNLARTFLNNPRFILLDEPTASLDPEGAKEVRDEILRIHKKENTTILWTSHNMAEVEEVCDRVIFLHSGTIIAVDSPAGLAKQINTTRLSLFVEKGQERLMKLIKIYKGNILTADRFTIIELSENRIPDFLAQLSKEHISYSGISIEKPTLEDYFIHISQKL